MQPSNPIGCRRSAPIQARERLTGCDWSAPATVQSSTTTTTSPLLILPPPLLALPPSHRLYRLGTEAERGPAGIRGGRRVSTPRVWRLGQHRAATERRRHGERDTKRRRLFVPASPRSQLARPHRGGLPPPDTPQRLPLPPLLTPRGAIFTRRPRWSKFVFARCVRRERGES